MAGRAAFTLVELIMVMALLCIVMAFSAPSLSRSMRQRHVADEAKRFLSLTEYAREEAISQGVPMSVWSNPESGRFGVEAKTGFAADSSRERDFALGPDVQMEIPEGKTERGITAIAEYAPDGIPEKDGAQSVRIVDRFGSIMTIVRTGDGLGFEIAKEAK